MSNFLSNMIDRHSRSENVVSPRIRGLFEPRLATLERPNIPTPLLGNEEGTADNESNSHFRLNEPPILDESPNAPQQAASIKAVTKGRTVFSTWQKLQEQTMIVPLGRKGTEQTAPLQKEAASTQPMQLAQQRILERIRLEVFKEEKGADGFSPDVPNHRGMDASIKNRQAEQLIKPLYKNKAPFWQDATPMLQEGEGKTPNYSSKVKPKTDGPFSQHLATLNILGGGQTPTAPPAIKVHIGRIEIKAVKESPVKQAKPQMPERRSSLDEFLKKRDNKL
jgi:hypothetical protein